MNKAYKQPKAVEWGKFSLSVINGGWAAERGAWNSAFDILPPARKLVLVLVCHADTLVYDLGYIHKGEWKTNIKGDVHWWMPLPEKPEAWYE